MLFGWTHPNASDGRRPREPQIQLLRLDQLADAPVRTWIHHWVLFCMSPSPSSSSSPLTSNNKDRKGSNLSANATSHRQHCKRMFTQCLSPTCYKIRHITLIWTCYFGLSFFFSLSLFSFLLSHSFLQNLYFVWLAFELVFRVTSLLVWILSSIETFTEGPASFFLLLFFTHYTQFVGTHQMHIHDRTLIPPAVWFYRHSTPMSGNIKVVVRCRPLNARGKLHRVSLRPLPLMHTAHRESKRCRMSDPHGRQPDHHHKQQGAQHQRHPPEKEASGQGRRRQCQGIHVWSVVLVRRQERRPVRRPGASVQRPWQGAAGSCVWRIQLLYFCM